MTTPALAASGLIAPQAAPGASLAAQQQQAAEFRIAQALLAAEAVREILALWGTLETGSIKASWPAIRAVVAGMIRDKFGLSSQAAIGYYLASRAAAGVPGTVAITAAPLPTQALIAATLDSTGPYGLLKRLKAAQPLPQAMQNTGVILSGAASRLIQNGARQTILRAVGADDKAVAWMRVTAADPCAFCAMLAGRGATYRTEASAGFKAHSMCRCAASPCFSESEARASKDNDLRRQWDEVTARLSGKDAIRAWRRYWDAQHPGVIGSRAAA